MPVEKLSEKAAMAGPVNLEIQDLIQQKAGRAPHEAMAACHDDEGMKWMMAYMQGVKPNVGKRYLHVDA